MTKLHELQAGDFVEVHTTINLYSFTRWGVVATVYDDYEQQVYGVAVDINVVYQPTGCDYWQNYNLIVTPDNKSPLGDTVHIDRLHSGE